MELPITKARLLNIDEEYRAIMKKRDLEKVLEHVTEQVMSAAYNKRTSFALYNTNGRYNLTELLVHFKKRFPDCLVVTDPLDTYLYIDWSLDGENSETRSANNG
jgi:hypothetical protein